MDVRTPNKLIKLMNGCRVRKIRYVIYGYYITNSYYQNLQEIVVIKINVIKININNVIKININNVIKIVIK